MADNNKRRAKLKELTDTIKANDLKVKAIFDGADKAGRTETSDEISEVNRIKSETDGLAQEAAELKSMLGIQIEISAREKASSETSNGHGHGEGQEIMAATMGRIKSLGNVFMDNSELKAWLSKFEGGNVPGKGKKIDSPVVEVKSFLKTLVTGASGEDVSAISTSGGALVFPDFKPIVDQFYQRPLTVRDLITIGDTSGDTVEYVRITGVTNQAGMVAEAANTTDGDASGRKPESAMAFERVAENVKTLAHWIPVTNRALADAGQLRTYIDNFLLYGIQEELEDQILQGNGSGENFTGIFNTSGINFQSFSTDALKTARKARTLVSLYGRTQPTAFLMHPLDWEAIDLSVDSNNRYYFGGPTAMGQKTLWGLPVVESEGCTQGEALVGNFKSAILWDRQQSQISMSNSHNDFFTRNLVAVLGEMRAAFGVIRAKAFCQFETVSGGS